MYLLSVFKLHFISLVIEINIKHEAMAMINMHITKNITLNTQKYSIMAAIVYPARFFVSKGSLKIKKNWKELIFFQKFQFELSLAHHIGSGSSSSSAPKSVEKYMKRLAKNFESIMHAGVITAIEIFIIFVNFRINSLLFT